VQPPTTVKVQRATSTKVRQTARPRVRRERDASGKFVKREKSPAPATAAPAAHRQTAQAKKTGARGGRGYYASRVRRAG
jgi:hypothetical protein